MALRKHIVCKQETQVAYFYSYTNVKCKNEAKYIAIEEDKELPVCSEHSNVPRARELQEEDYDKYGTW